MLKESINQKGDTIVIENHIKPPSIILKQYLTELLYDKLTRIYDQIRTEGKVEILGNIDFEVIEKIDSKKERIAKLKGNRILVKINASALPEEALKYVITHEIAHTFTKRHTKRFWNIMGAIHPNYEKAQNILTEYHKILVSSPLR